MPDDSVRGATSRPSAASRTSVVEFVEYRPGGVAPFEDFYRRTYPDALRLATFLVGVANAEDVVQECFAEVFQRFGGLQQPAAYLKVALANRCRALHRSTFRRRRRESLVAPSESVEPVHRELLDILGCLPYNQRAVLVLRIWAGWSDSEIAVVLGCRPPTVRSHARRALGRLREELER